MTYFRVTWATSNFITEELRMGRLFYKNKHGGYVPCGEYFDGSYSYYAMPRHEVFIKLHDEKNLYWRNDL